MKTDLCGDEVVVHLTAPQILATEEVNTSVSVADAFATGGGATPAARASSAAVECGRRLLLAARAGDTATVRQLMASGAPFTTDWLGTSPLHLAAANDHVETVGVLLRAGVSRDARTKTERTPLHLAAYAGHARAVARLLEGGAMVDARDLLQMTALHWAVERGHVAAARELLRRGADPLARSKFRKTPLQLAAARAARGEPALLRLVEDCRREQEAAQSVSALVTERTTEEATPVTPQESSTVRIQRVSETKMTTPKIATTPEKKQTKSTLKIDSVTELPVGGEGGGGGAGGAVGGGAEALLRRHGITLLPADDHSTVLNALQSGRTVVLSDAGKLMLKESSGSAPAGGARPEGGVVLRATPEGGVVLRATPVGAPPPGVKVFTLNSNAKVLPVRDPPKPAQTAPQPAPQTKPDGADSQQVKLVQLGGGKDAAGGGGGRGAGGGGGGGGGGAGRAAVRIIMNKQNFRKLIATAARATRDEECGDASALSDWSSSDSEGGESVVVVPEQFVRSSSPQYLRSQLLCAHAALHHLRRRLRRHKRPHRSQR